MAPNSKQEFSSDTKARIETLLKSGMSQNAVAKEVGVSASAVNRLAKRRGIEAAHKAPDAAIEAKAQYDLAGRLEVNNKLFNVIMRKLDDPSLTAKDVKDLSLAAGIATDKRRLEEGESTSRSEQRVSKDLNLEEEFAKLDSLMDDSSSPSSNGTATDAD